MRKLLISILFVALLTTKVSATWATAAPPLSQEVQVELITSASSVAIGEKLDLTVRIKKKWSSWINPWTFELEGLSKFNIVWKFSSSKTNVMNWSVLAVIDTRLTLVPKGEWTFRLWPVKINYSGITYESNTVEVTVWKTKQEESIDSEVIDEEINLNWTTDYTELFKSFEFWLFIILLIIAWQMWRNNNSIKDIPEIEQKFIVPEPEDKDFLDKSLNLIIDFVLDKYWLDSLKWISPKEVQKIEKDPEKRKVLSEIIEKVYNIKSWKLSKEEWIIEIRDMIKDVVKPS